MVSRTRQLERCNFEISVRIWTGSCAPSSQILSVLRGVRISRRASLLLLEILYCRVVKSRSSVTSLTHCRLRLVRDRGEIFLHLMCTPYGRCRTRRERRDKMKSVDCLQYGTGMTLDSITFRVFAATLYSDARPFLRVCVYFLPGRGGCP